MWGEFVKILKPQAFGEMLAASLPATHITTLITFLIAFAAYFVFIAFVYSGAWYKKRYMNTPNKQRRKDVIHYAELFEPFLCRADCPADTKWSTNPKDCTCPECLEILKRKKSEQ